METQFKYCKNCNDMIGYKQEEFCSKCKEEIDEERDINFKQALLVVGSKMIVRDSGLIVCSEEKWETLDFKYKAAVYYLSNEFDFTVVDE